MQHRGDADQVDFRALLQVSAPNVPALLQGTYRRCNRNFIGVRSPAHAGHVSVWRIFVPRNVANLDPWARRNGGIPMRALSSIGKFVMAIVACTGLGVAAWCGLATVNPQTTGNAPPVVTTPPAPMTIGMNLGMMTYWSQEYAFVDLIKASGLKIVRDGRWVDIADQLTLDRDGHPIGVPMGTMLAVGIRSGGVEHLPRGPYDCLISPGWMVRPSVATRINGNGTRFQLTLTENPQRASLTLKLTATTDHASLTQLSCRDHALPPDQVFSPQFLAENRPFVVLRFMDWMKANNQPPQTWATRTTPASFSQTSASGVAVEHMVSLANTLDADPWFSLPLDAPDDYYRQFAQYVRDNLKPDRCAYVEVSNEVWNRSFGQSKQASAEGAARYPSASAVEANDFYYGDRIRVVMGIWSDVYKGQSRRIVRVLSEQAASKTRAVSALSHLDTASSIDALAIAPYFGPVGGKFPEGLDVTEYLLSHGDEYIDSAVRHGRDSKAIADRFHLRLITYEGGPAYVSFRPRLAAAFAKAEQDPRMYGIYTKFLGRWRDEVGGLFMPYDTINTRFGHLLYTGQPLAQAPKMRALLDFIERQHLNGGRK
ncbi:MAG: hypothetical protein JWR80_6966 [Bradyrhizobium sp.]|nr:hypothetical protein [Bradyrhizobium sp.]